MDMDQFIRLLPRLIERLERESVQRDNKLAEEINALSRRAAGDDHGAELERAKELLTHTYNQAAAYTNVIILAGYAGTFAIFQLLKDSLCDLDRLWIAILLCASLITFVGWEVWKMIGHALMLRGVARLLSSAKLRCTPSEAFKIAADKFSMREAQLWGFFLVPAVLTGFGAGAWLLVRFLLEVIHGGGRSTCG